MAKFEYTDEQRSEMIRDYVACGTATTPEAEAARAEVVESWGAKTGGVRSVRGVLSRANVYVAKVAKAKDGKPAVRKEVLVNRIVELTEGNSHRMASLVNATKDALQDLVDYLEATAEVDDD